MFDLEEGSCHGIIFAEARRKLFLHLDEFHFGEIGAVDDHRQTYIQINLIMREIESDAMRRGHSGYFLIVGFVVALRRVALSQL